MYRTHTCGELRKTNEGDKVIISGWVHRRRDHGGLIFIDLRDGYGITQIVFDPSNKKSYDIGNICRNEYVLHTKGSVRKRPEGMKNKNIITGEIEILVDNAEILNKSLTPPFEVDQNKDVAEDLRLKYRYIDLRRGRLHENIVNRHKIIKSIRDFMDSKEFIEVETPMMIKGTPEGSREYIIPSRLYPGHFYVLPQSPQQLKQLLMISSFDRYFQIARSFRDEDQRGDRQPEFTQLDLEMAFVHEEDVIQVTEEMMINISEKYLPDKKIQNVPFNRLKWHDAINLYGSDKPDLRFEMQLTDVSDIVANSEFKVFKNVIQTSGVVKSLRVENGASYTRKEIDELEETAKIFKAKGLAYIKFKETGPESPIVKFFSSDELDKIKKRTDAQEGDIVFFTADQFEIACESLGQIRLKCAKKDNIINDSILSYIWVTHFPLFTWNEEEQHISSEHHPFTHPLDEDIDLLEKNPEKVRAKAYDLILNGVEIGGGSIRIHDQKLQSLIFETLGITEKEAEKKFGHLLKALKYGAPPHGGIALGLDRLIMLFRDEPNIREVIAFPKDQKARDLMLDAPSELPASQISEMHIEVHKPKNK